MKYEGPGMDAGVERIRKTTVSGVAREARVCMEKSLVGWAYVAAHLLSLFLKAIDFHLIRNG